MDCALARMLAKRGAELGQVLVETIAERFSEPGDDRAIVIIAACRSARFVQALSGGPPTGGGCRLPGQPVATVPSGSNRKVAVTG
jgi:hypothetical protein